MSKWSIPIDQVVADAKGQLENVAREATLNLFSEVVQRSPVGNPDLWKKNSGQVYKRETHNLFAELINANATKRSKATIKSARSLRKLYPNRIGKGYVGGRFRANWNVSFGTPDESVSASTDLSRAMGEVNKTLTLPVGGLMYLTNALAYGHRLEYDSWSRQAPAGMVRVSALLFPDFVKRASGK